VPPPGRREQVMVRKVTLSELKQSRESNPGLVLVEALPESYYRKHHIPLRDQHSPRGGRRARPGALA